ncbi:helix-turn-helix transcriptional regulator [Longitalea luteola]|uniref:helix-turn-helix transcriptional regulator n=1 Tax=Longitalea luteola TaxID=2812563 RepID=UPI001A969EF8|nr:AraC family transcriptional regulator [Longitalea luteola]
MALEINIIRQFVYNVHNYIESNLDKELSIKELADASFLSYSRFRHLYEEISGEPIWQYIKRYRLEYAGGLLRHSNYSCAEIAEKVGYLTPHSFNKAFSQHFGASPKRFRSIDMLPIDKEIKEQVNENIFDQLQNFHQLQEDGLIRFEKIANKTFCYKRMQGPMGPATFDFLVNLIKGYCEKQLVLTSPDVACVSDTDTIRLNYGFLVEGNDAFIPDTEYFKKRITWQQYLVNQYRGPLALLKWYVYKLIDAGRKSGNLAITGHDFLMIIPPNSGVVELWIPV